VAGTAGAYPLTMLTYAALDTSESADARRDYAAFLRYAAGAGQQPGSDPGDLPPGYVPLSDALRAETRAVAARLERWVAPTGTPEPAATGGGTGRATATGAVPDAGARPSAVTSATASAKPVPKSQTTPDEYVGAVRYVLLIALAVGVLGTVTGPVLLVVDRYRGRRSG
jgi:hypothetical protein